MLNILNGSVRVLCVTLLCVRAMERDAATTNTPPIQKRRDRETVALTLPCWIGLQRGGPPHLISMVAVGRNEPRQSNGPSQMASTSLLPISSESIEDRIPWSMTDTIPDWCCSNGHQSAVSCFTEQSCMTKALSHPVLGACIQRGTRHSKIHKSDNNYTAVERFRSCALSVAARGSSMSVCFLFFEASSGRTCRSLVAASIR